MSESGTERGPERRWLAGYLKKTMIVAFVVAALLLGAVVLLDRFGSQPQPFQYLLH